MSIQGPHYKVTHGTKFFGFAYGADEDEARAEYKAKLAKTNETDWPYDWPHERYQALVFVKVEPRIFIDTGGVAEVKRLIAEKQAVKLIGP